MGESVRLRRREGLTLIEVMIALTILAVGLLSLAAMQLEALRGGRSGHVDTYAATLGQDLMERYQRMSWASVNPTNGWVGPFPVKHPVFNQSYGIEWRITNVVPNWTRAIDLRVTWSDTQRSNRSRVFSTIRYNREEL